MYCKYTCVWSFTLISNINHANGYLSLIKEFSILNYAYADCLKYWKEEFFYLK